MAPAEPAGCEADGGKPAELCKEASLHGGVAGNTRGTVCNKNLMQGCYLTFPEYYCAFCAYP